MKKNNAIYGVLGLLLVLMGITGALLGLSAVVDATIFQTLTGWAIFGIVQVVAIVFLVLSAAAMAIGFQLVAQYGGKTLKVVLALAALFGALVSIILAIVTIETVVGLVVFLVAMVFFLIVADWGLGTKFVGKFLKSLPVVGKFLNQIAKILLP